MDVVNGYNKLSLYWMLYGMYMNIQPELRRNRKKLKKIVREEYLRLLRNK